MEYFGRVVFEQFLNKQRRVPSNDTVVFENWPSSISPSSLEIILTTVGSSADLAGVPIPNGKSINASTKEIFTNSTTIPVSLELNYFYILRLKLNNYLQIK